MMPLWMFLLCTIFIAGETVLVVDIFWMRAGNASMSWLPRLEE